MQIINESLSPWAWQMSDADEHITLCSLSQQQLSPYTNPTKGSSKLGRVPSVFPRSGTFLSASQTATRPGVGAKLSGEVRSEWLLFIRTVEPPTPDATPFRESLGCGAATDVSLELPQPSSSRVRR
jgi:hypothetical protein